MKSKKKTNKQKLSTKAKTKQNELKCLELRLVSPSKGQLVEFIILDTTVSSVIVNAQLKFSSIVTFSSLLLSIQPNIEKAITMYHVTSDD